MRATSAKSAETSVDDLDQRLIDLLIMDGRLSNRALASELGLTDQTVASRIRRLMESGVIVIGPEFDWRAAGYRSQALAFVSVDGTTPIAVGKMIAGHPGVLLVNATYGSADLVVMLAATSDMGIHWLVTEMGGVPGVSRVQVEHICEVYGYSRSYVTLPYEPTSVLELPDPPFSLDEVDDRIIQALRSDGRISSREISRQIGVTDATVRSRTRRMEECGLMRVVAKVDPFVSGRVGGSAFIGLTADCRVDELLRDIAIWPNMSLCAASTGRHNILAALSSETHEQLDELVTEKLWELDGVRSVHAWPVSNVVFHRSDLVRIL